MAKLARNAVLSPSRDIPFNNLVLSQSNVRRIRIRVSVEEPAKDIAHRGLLQCLNAGHIRDAGFGQGSLYRASVTLTVSGLEHPPH